MSITLSDGATTLVLSNDLVWSDEFDWSATEQSIARGLTGALIIQSATRQAGRPITLANADESTGLLTRTQLAQLRAWADLPGQALTLSLHGAAYPVLFRHQDGALSGRALTHPDHPEAGLYVLATLRFMTTS